MLTSQLSYAKPARIALHKSLAELESCGPEAIQDGAFQVVEEQMAQLRLYCMRTFFLDIELSREKDVENILWHTQTKINQVYRKVLGQLRKAPRTHVLRHKVERRYLGFLKVSQGFYKAFIQRLASRYIVQDIEEICKNLGLEILQESDRVDPVASQVDSIISKSCYNSLIHLGDLSRYRYQQSQKGLDSGISYYNLAQKLNPHDGTAHHQMGVFYNEQHRDLDITYHFYRAAVCNKAHPNATMNLDVEFKRALGPNFVNRRGNNTTLAPQEALKYWFVRLHAHFRKGVIFDEYEELEKEVIHRLGRTWRSSETADALLQIILVNFCAYHKARCRTSGEWTMSNSQFYQFCLRLIIRTTLSLAEAIYLEITNMADDRGRLSTDGTEAKAETFPPALVKLLPLFRLTCGWMVYHHREVVECGEHLEPYIDDMYRMVAKAQTQFSTVFGDACPNASEIATYLLPEDEETVGLLAMDNEEVFYALRFHYTKDGARKPRGHIVKTEEDRTRENWWRVRDILNCGVFLAADPKLPLQLVEVKGVSEMIYAEDAPAISAETSPMVEKAGVFDQALDLLAQAGNAEVPTCPFNAQSMKSSSTIRTPQMTSESPTPHMEVKSPGTLPAAQLTATGYATSSTDSISATVAAIQASMPEPLAQDITELSRVPTMVSEETDTSLDKKMASMVEDLVATEPAESKARSPADSSYPISPSTAALLSKLQSPEKVLPSPSWNYFLAGADMKAFDTPRSQVAGVTAAQGSGIGVYAQIYGKASSFSNPSSTSKTQGGFPGWTVAQDKAVHRLSVSPPNTKPQLPALSPTVSGVSAQSPSNIWGPVFSAPWKAEAQTPTSKWTPGPTTKSPRSAGLLVPDQGSQTAHIRKTSQGDYDMLYQRLANMTADSEPMMGARQQSHLRAGASYTPNRQLSGSGLGTQKYAQPSIAERPNSGSPTTGVECSSELKKKPAISQWPPYVQTRSSAATSGLSGSGAFGDLGRGVSVASPPGPSRGTGSAGPTGFGASPSQSRAASSTSSMLPGYVSGSAGFPGSQSSIWASTRQGYNGHGLGGSEPKKNDGAVTGQGFSEFSWPAVSPTKNYGQGLPSGWAGGTRSSGPGAGQVGRR